MSSLRLPSGLIDLVLARTSTSTNSGSRAHAPLRHALSTRNAHSPAMLKPRITPAVDTVPPAERDFYARLKRRTSKKNETAVAPLDNPSPRPTSALAERIGALREAVALPEEGEVEPGDRESFSEEELLAVYEDLLASPIADSPDAQAAQQVQEPELDPAELVSSAATRLLGEASSSSQDVSFHSLRHNLISHLEEAQKSLESLQASLLDTEVAGENVPLGSLPVRLMSDEEWAALVMLSARERDGSAAERVLDLMKRSKIPIAEEQFSAVLEMYARLGDVSRADDFVSKYLSDAVSERQRDLHIKAHLQVIPETSFPTDALRLLHEYEERGLAPPQKTYSRLVTHLLSARSAVAHAHAWDLFAHMRYVAHPNPDALMYVTMIRACASSSLSAGGEPERALDLFTEMLTDSKHPPTADAYVAVILACARSGREQYVREAFRLAKEMIDAHRDARGIPAFAPDRRLFAALLEAAKRVGDIARTRWLLAEMVKQSVVRGAVGDIMDAPVLPERAIREDMMVHVFHAYAAYKPAFKRSMATIVKEKDAKECKESGAATDATSSASEAQADTPDAPAPESKAEESKAVTTNTDAAFMRLPPQSHAEVVHEVQLLFTRIVAHTQRGEGVFAHVELTPRLLNAYLAVHYAHAPLETWRDLFRTVYAELGVPRNAWTYVDVLERCARAKKERDERRMAATFAEEVWGEWVALERAWRSGEAGDASARLVERAHAAMVRVYALTGQLDRAMDIVKGFVAAYPPQQVRTPPPKPEFRSTRTNLIAPRPLVRMFNAVDIPDDAVPPLLSFPEIEALHHRLVAAGPARAKDIKYLKWMCKAYEGALRMRREKALAVPKPRPRSEDVSWSGRL